MKRDERAELEVSQRKSHKQSKAMHIRTTTNPEMVVPNLRDCKEKVKRVTDSGHQTDLLKPPVT